LGRGLAVEHHHGMRHALEATGRRFGARNGLRGSKGGSARRSSPARPRLHESEHNPGRNRDSRSGRGLPRLYFELGCRAGRWRRAPAVEAGGVRGGIRRRAPWGFWSRWLDAEGPGGAGGWGGATGAAPAAASCGGGLLCGGAGAGGALGLRWRLRDGDGGAGRVAGLIKGPGDLGEVWPGKVPGGDRGRSLRSRGKRGREGGG